MANKTKKQNYYNFVYNEKTGFPSIKEAIKIDSELYV